MRLIDFVGQYQSLLNRLDNCEIGEETDIGLHLNDVVDALEDKLERCAWIYRNLCQEEAAYRSEAARLEAKASQKGRQADLLKNYIGYCLQGKSVKTKTFSLHFRKSESVEVLDAAIVPEQYQRTKTIVEPDKTLIKADLRAGATIPGCVLIEKLNLQIK